MYLMYRYKGFLLRVWLDSFELNKSAFLYYRPWERDRQRDRQRKRDII